MAREWPSLLVRTRRLLINHMVYGGHRRAGSRPGGAGPTARQPRQPPTRPSCSLARLRWRRVPQACHWLARRCSRGCRPDGGASGAGRWHRVAGCRQAGHALLDHAEVGHPVVDPSENVRTGQDDLPRNRQDGACVPPERRCTQRAAAGCRRRAAAYPMRVGIAIRSRLAEAVEHQRMGASISAAHAKIA